MKKHHRPKRHIALAIPCYTGLVCAGTMRAVLGDGWRLLARGDQLAVSEEVGNADIARCRAMIVAKFLADKSATHLVMIDADVCWEPGGLLRLVDAEPEFVCAAYPKRLGERGQTTYHMRLIDRPVQGLDPATQLLEVEAMPAGMMVLKREVLTRMVAHYPESKFSFRECPGGIAWDLFDGVWETDATGLRHKLGEDYSFCRRWRDMGGRIWVDPTIATGHIGTHMWQGCLAEKFRAPPASEAA